MRTLTRIALMAAIIVLPVSAQCDGFWTEDFNPPGTPRPVTAMTAYDSGLGAGPQLFAASIIPGLGGGSPVRGILVFDGATWEADANLPTPDRLNDLQVFDDGTGAKLYAGGRWVQGSQTFGLAVFDGTSWTLSGEMAFSGAPNPVQGLEVQSLDVVNDGNGDNLFAGGIFDVIGTVTTPYIGRFDGTAWSALGSGLAPATNALIEINGVAFDGTDLFLAGTLPASMGATDGLMRFDGTLWSSEAQGSVSALTAWDDGTGLSLYGGVAASEGGFAEWTTAGWAPVGLGVQLTNATTALPVNEIVPGTDNAGSPALYVIGNFRQAGNIFAGGIARWDGSGYSVFQNGVNFTQEVTGIVPGANGSFQVGGGFLRAGIKTVSYVAEWTGSTWTRLGVGKGADTNGRAIQIYNDGTSVTAFLAQTTPTVTRWTGTEWVDASIGMFENDSVSGFIVFDDSSLPGPQLFAYGTFQGTYGLARWAPGVWIPVPGPPPGVTAATVGNDGSGIAVFLAAGQSAAGSRDVWRWDGLNTFLYAPNLTTSITPLATVKALEWWDDGTGLALYAGGSGLNGQASIESFARFDGNNWQGVTGLGAQSMVEDLHVHKGQMIVSGRIASQSHIASFDGMTFTPVGGGVSGAAVPGSEIVLSMTSWSTGYLNFLVAVGNFGTAGGTAAQNVAVFDGNTWTPLGSGISNVGRAQVVTFDFGIGDEPLIAGDFIEAGGKLSQGVARWRAYRPTLTLRQTGGSVFVDNEELFPGNETFNVVSVEPCTTGLGTGPILGLCATDPNDLFNQALLPLGTPFFHFTAPSQEVTWGPISGLPTGMTFEVVTFQIGGPASLCPSKVRSITVQ